MQIIYADRVKETSTTTGTGAYTLAGAVTGFRTFAAVGNAKQCGYASVDDATGEWEVGIGTYTSAGTLLTRTQVIASSNAGAAVNWAAGTRSVFCTFPSSALNLLAINQVVLTWDPPATLMPTVSSDAILALGPYCVASAANAIAIGMATASAANALAIGADVRASGVRATAIGSGSMTDATGARSVAIGGSTNSTDQVQATGVNSVAIASNGGEAGTDGSVLIGGGITGGTGGNNAVTGIDSAAIGGSKNEAAGRCSTVIGYYAKSRFYGSLAWGGGDSVGKAQGERCVQRGSTTNATTTALAFNADAATNGRLNFPANSGVLVSVKVIGRETATGDSIAFRLEGNIAVNGSGVPSLVGSTPAAVDLGHAAGAATWTAALAIDGANNCLLVNVTGEASKTIKWVAMIDSVEVVA